MSLLFFNTEFTGLHKNTTLISLGIVSDCGKRFYAEFEDYDENQCNEWIKENVLKNLYIPTFAFNINYKNEIRKWEREGYEVSEIPEILRGNSLATLSTKRITEDGTMEVKGSIYWISYWLEEWLSQFESIQFVSDVCHYDFVLLIDLFGSAFDLPENINPACHDINQDIALHYGISEREAFDKSREEIVADLCDSAVSGRKHNSLYDAEVIKVIFEAVSM